MTDITKHEWHDSNVDTIDAEPIFEGVQRIVLTSDGIYVKLYKSDAIAIAKHFGVLKQDLLLNYVENENFTIEHHPV